VTEPGLVVLFAQAAGPLTPPGGAIRAGAFSPLKAIQDLSASTMEIERLRFSAKLLLLVV
jgi:hypothetical protein